MTPDERQLLTAMRQRRPACEIEGVIRSQHPEWSAKVVSLAAALAVVYAEMDAAEFLDHEVDAPDAVEALEDANPGSQAVQ
jgi:hypothetical protein